jgi:hypothetical protein
MDEGRSGYGWFKLLKEVSRKNGGNDNKSLLCLPPVFTLVSCLAHSSTLKTEAMFSETSVEFQRTARRYIPEVRTLHTKSHPENKSQL